MAHTSRLLAMCAVRGERLGTVRVFLTVGFFPHDEPTVSSNCELTVATCCAFPPISDAG